MSYSCCERKPMEFFEFIDFFVLVTLSRHSHFIASDRVMQMLTCLYVLRYRTAFAIKINFLSKLLFSFWIFSFCRIVVGWLIG